MRSSDGSRGCARGDACRRRLRPSNGRRDSVRLMVPYPAGGNVDSAARIIADKLQERARPAVRHREQGRRRRPDRRRGVREVAPDGYTLFVGANGPVLFAPEIAKRDAYDWKRDFVPITTISMTPLVLEVHPSVQATTVKEFFDLARASPAS